MALQDLTPQLRTRLSRMERAVGWFVLLATALLVFGFAYYVRNTARRKGWFVAKASYYTFTDRATGIKVGDPVSLMGFEIGQITRIDTMDPSSPYNVYVEFQIREPYNGYLWTGHNGSRAKVVIADLLGKRALEVTKGTDRIESLLAQVETALPNVFGLTNSIARALTHGTELASNFNVVALDAQPIASNLARLSAQLRDPGSLGEWVLGTNAPRQFETT